MGRYVLLTGVHEQGTSTTGKKRYKAGDIVESDSRLDKLFPNRFERAGYAKKLVSGDIDEDDDEVTEDTKVAKVANKSRRKAVKKMLKGEEDAADAAAERRRKKKEKSKKRKRNKQNDD